MYSRTYLLPLIIISAVLIVAGCSSGTNDGDTTLSQGSGIQATKFTTERTTLRSNSNAFLHLSLKNTGGRKATDVRAQLYGLTFGDCASCWQITDNSPSCQLKSSQWACIGKLRAPRVQQNVAGESQEARWTLQAPAVPAGSSQDAKFFARIHYGYESQATPQLVLVNRDEASQQPTTSPVQIETSVGPLEFTSRTESPMVISGSGGSRSFCISAQNTGKGTVYSEQAGIGNPEGYEDKFQVSVSFEGLGIDKQRQMRMNSTACFDFQPGTVAIRQRLPITITTSYNYFFDAIHEATVTGQ